MVIHAGQVHLFLWDLPQKEAEAYSRSDDNGKKQL